MTRKLTALLVVLIPALLFANVMQAFRYSQLDREISRLEREAQDLLEENKRIILAIALLSSPQRIGDLAQDELGLRRVDPDDITHMRIPDLRGDR